MAHCGDIADFACACAFPHYISISGESSGNVIQIAHLHSISYSSLIVIAQSGL